MKKLEVGDHVIIYGYIRRSFSRDFRPWWRKLLRLKDAEYFETQAYAAASNKTHGFVSEVFDGVVRVFLDDGSLDSVLVNRRQVRKIIRKKPVRVVNGSGGGFTVPSSIRVGLNQGTNAEVASRTYTASSPSKERGEIQGRLDSAYALNWERSKTAIQDLQGLCNILGGADRLKAYRAHAVTTQTTQVVSSEGSILGGKFKITVEFCGQKFGATGVST